MAVAVHTTGAPAWSAPIASPFHVLARMPRALLELIAEAAIAELDRRDGDPDAEPEEDEHAALRLARAAQGPGDPDDAEPDQFHPLSFQATETRHAG